ncbi:hypothetical protein [Haloarchaeobius iranensis]|uniref:Uncharacterized protein n=1 Tax=Haloarchaeobius iranensis TaxID=996166 RepID=A0A1G9T6V8_9EURY|nr:hypothetical protein [Haloarchaeobius iranensis]SDM43340.1 hypothetical protein SAMN05192554_102167 [Haloarchaeobius iranensis]
MAWECDECGTRSTSPPCDECGSEHGEYTGFVWVCPECGRQSTKNNPPCPRCGGMDLEQRRPDYSDIDAETAVPGYAQLAKPLVPLFLVVAVVVALFATGVVPLPEDLDVALNGPRVVDAPGSADQAGGLNLSDVESGILDRVDDYRAERGGDALSRDDTLADMVTFANQRQVATSYDGGSVRGGLRDFSPDCQPAIYLLGSTDSEGATVDDFERESAAAQALFDVLVSNTEGSATLADATDAHATDIHVAPDGRIYAAYAVC